MTLLLWKYHMEEFPKNILEVFGSYRIRHFSYIVLFLLSAIEILYSKILAIAKSLTLQQGFPLTLHLH